MEFDGRQELGEVWFRVGILSLCAVGLGTNCVGNWSHLTGIQRNPWGWRLNELETLDRLGVLETLDSLSEWVTLDGLGLETLNRLDILETFN